MMIIREECAWNIGLARVIGGQVVGVMGTGKDDAVHIASREVVGRWHRRRSSAGVCAGA
jgi:hypothetical protein